MSSTKEDYQKIQESINKAYAANSSQSNENKGLNQGISGSSQGQSFGGSLSGAQTSGFCQTQGTLQSFQGYGTCPSCGYCRHCGRGGSYYQPYYYNYPYGNYNQTLQGNQQYSQTTTASSVSKPFQR